MSEPIQHTGWQPVMCPECRQVCGATDRHDGELVIHCKRCRAWRKVALSSPATRRATIDARLRVVIEGS